MVLQMSGFPSFSWLNDIALYVCVCVYVYIYNLFYAFTC